MKVVVDTNVLISGIINPYGKPVKILNLVLEKNSCSALTAGYTTNMKRLEAGKTWRESITYK